MDDEGGDLRFIRSTENVPSFIIILFDVGPGVFAENLDPVIVGAFSSSHSLKDELVVGITLNSRSL